MEIIIVRPILSTPMVDKTIMKRAKQTCKDHGEVCIIVNIELNISYTQENHLHSTPMPSNYC